MKKVFTVSFVSLFTLFSGLSMDFSVDMNPGIVFPSGKCAEIMKGPAFGADVGFNLHFLDLITVGPEIGVDYIIKEGEPSSIVDIAPGIKAGAYMYPWGRLGFGLNAAAGIHFASYDYPGEKNASGNGYKEGREPGSLKVCNPYIRFEGSVNYRLTSSIALGLRGGYVIDFFDGHDFDDGFSPFMAGPEVGIGLRYSFSNVKPEQHVEASISQFGPIYPLLMNVYKDVDFGTVHITNSEDAEIKNVRVYFKAAPYTSSSYLCGKIKKIRKGQTYDIPLKGDFSQELAKFSDDGSFPGEITITYDYMGNKMTTTESVLVSTYNRNTMNWSDPNSIAAFISPSDETILELSKFAGATAKSNLRSGLNSKLQTTIYMTELFGSLGIQRIADKVSPYVTSHGDTTKNDYIQYPFQTLTYMSGDSDELGIVFASLLEAVSVDAALIPDENDFIVAAELGLSAKGVEGLFADPDQLVIIGDEYYLPLSANNLGKGFNAAWKAGSRQLRAEMEKKTPDFVILKDAWQSYPPLGLSVKRNVAKPSSASLIARASRELESFTSDNIRPKIRASEALVSSGKATDDDRIALGLLYVRAGDTASAAAIFRPLSDKGNITAMNNLANIYILQKDFSSAKRLYEKVLEKDDKNGIAKKGLERIANEK